MFASLRNRHSLPPYPRPPDDVTLYAVGDIHGRDDLLAQVHAAIDVDAAESPATAFEIYLGDYIDRGPASAQVIDRLIARAAIRRVALLRGNHEEVFEAFLAGRLAIEEWRAFGGIETCRSYGCNPEELGVGVSSRQALAALAPRVPAEHRSFLATLRDHFEVGDYLFVHAGIRPDVPLAAQTSRDIRWIRAPFLSHAGSFGAIVVHGHTPVRAVDFRPNRINIDTGAVTSDLLTCLRIGEEGISILDPRPEAWR